MSASLPNMAPHEGLRWGGSLGLVLLAHALAVAAVLWWGARVRLVVADAPLEAVLVDLAPEPVTPPAPPQKVPQEVPPGPPQRQQQRSPPQPKPPPPPDVVPEVVEPTPPAPSPQPPATEDIAQSLAPPAAKSVEARTAAAQTAAGRSDGAQATWQGKLLGHLQRHRRYPQQAQWHRQEGVVYVRFEVDRGGNVSGIRLGRSSGLPALDEEALATVKRASPVPAPADEVEGDPVEVMVPVEFFLRRR